ncbi:MAG: zinc ABC transporter substrate-binding protein, partial [Gammaproteobacteria bacterium]|nr:zinc ABC transporter substrate-binding protein [Gammaproteobacteria bacterium]
MTRRILAFVAHALGTLMIGTAPLAWAEKPLVTTTLHPLSLILSGIAGDQVEIRTLIPGNASPHTYQLRPSERQLLDEAALIVWVGPDMETFLDRLMHQPALSSKVLTLWPGAKMPAKDADDHDHDHAAHKPSTDTHAHDEHDEHDEHDHDHGAGQDPHIWLDPALVVQIGEQMHARLRT